MEENKKETSAGTEVDKKNIDEIKLKDGNHLRCHNCKKVIWKSARYCPYCGTFIPK